MATVKKTFYLHQDQGRRLKEIAGADRVSEAEVVRRAIDHYLRTRMPNPLLGRIGTVTGGPRDGAANHDRYIYGEQGADAREAPHR